jgi:hypothetical protein
LPNIFLNDYFRASEGGNGFLNMRIYRADRWMVRIPVDLLNFQYICFIMRTLAI